MSINFKHFITSIALLLTSFSVFASQADTAVIVAPAAQEASQHKEGMNISEVIFGHVKDAYEWHIFTLGDFEASIHFPVILYSPTKGLSAFSSSRFGTHEAPTSYQGYRLEGGNNIVAEDGSRIYDLSLTKNVMAMFAAVILMLIIFISVSNKYKRNGSDKAPSGFQNAIEVCIEFIQDEVAKPALGVHYRRFMPLLLTIFFFIWITSMLGLIPGGANLTGNIAVTCCLAIIAFAVMLFSSKKHFWGHLFNPPGMPFFVKVILVPIELISLIIKPTALMIRLFANMLAGHIVLICFALLIFIFAEMNVFIGSGFSVISVALSTFSMLIELLVAAIQAYIFAFLTAIFVGQMIEEHSHDTGENGFGFTDTETELVL